MRSGLTILLFCVHLTSPGQEKGPISLLDYIDLAQTHFDVDFSFNHQLASETTVEFSGWAEDVTSSLSDILVGTRITFQVTGKSVTLYPDPNQSERSINVAGVIMDSNGKESLPNALIRIPGLNSSTVSNRDGHFKLLKIPSDTMAIHISYLGYKDYKTTVGQLVSQPAVEMQANPEILKELVIEGEQQELINVVDEPSKISLNTHYFNALGSFGQSDAFRSLQLLPGINGSSEVSSGIRIRDSSADQNLVLFDGFTVYHLDHFFGVFSAFNSKMIKDIQVYKGGFGARYGGRVSSVIEMIAKNGNQDKVSGQFSANFISADGVIEIPIGKKVTVVAGGRRSYTDVIQSNLFNKLFDQVNTANNLAGIEEEEVIDPKFHFYDFNFKTTVRLTSDDLIQASIYRGKDDLAFREFFEDSDVDFVFEQEISESSEWGNSGESLRYAKNWNKKFYSDFILTRSEFFRNQDFLTTTFFEDTVEIIDEELSFTDENTIEEIGFNTHNLIRLNNQHTISAGAFFNHHTINYRSLFFDEDEDLNFNLSGLNTGVYVDHDYAIHRLQTNLGVRSSYYDIENRFYFEPRFSVTYQLHDQLSLKGAIGRYYQFVGRVTTFNSSFGQDDFWILRGLDESPVISSNHFIAGANFKLNAFELDVEIYRKNFDGLSSYLVDSLFRSDSDIDGEITQGTGIVKGVDILLKRESHNLTSWISYTHSNAYNRFEDINEGERFPGNFNQKHEIKIVNSLQFNAWNFTSTWLYGSGQPYTPRIVGFEDEDSLPIGFINSERLPPYHRLDLNIAYLKKLNKIDLRFSLNLLNLYNHRNIRDIFFLEQFDDEIDDFEINELKMQMLDFTPSVGVEIKF